MAVRVFEAERCLIEVVCNHPDYSSEDYNFAVEYDEFLPVFMSDEQKQEWHSEIRRQIEAKVNPVGFWHEVEITLVFHIDGKEYRKSI